MAEARRRGIGLASMDGLLAATAFVHDLTLATRNIRDFNDLGVALFDPWSS
jgi:predicted nucleic acid-binding protein